MSESPDRTVSAAAIEDAAVAARMRGNGSFTLQDVLALLPGGDAELEERAKRLLAGDDTLFGDDKGNYIGRNEFFAGTEFVITPSDFEIEEGILFPGHRFTAFVSADVFPSEISLREERHKRGAALCEISGELGQFFPYHMMMGSEQVFDFFIAENEKNHPLAHGAAANAKVWLNVFDLHKFYDANQFSSGDALLCKVRDWAEGDITFRYLSGEKRRAADITGWVGQFTVAVENVIDLFSSFFDIPEQLAWAFYFGDPALRSGATAASLDEFIRTTKGVEIHFEGGHASLTRRHRAAEIDDADFEIPDGVQVSKGATDSIGAILKENEITVSPVEMDSYILDCCFNRELEFDGFYDRCFGREKIDFADEAQEVAFLNYVEDRWEELSGNYNRVDDEVKGPVRGQILEVIDEKIEFLNSLRGIDGAHANLPQEELHRLAEISLYLDEMLRMLNDPAQTLDPADAEEMAEKIADIDDTQDALIGKLEENLK